MKRLGILLGVLACTLGFAADNAHGYSNGQLPGSALAPIYNPYHAPRQWLAKDGAASAANSLNLGLYQGHKPLLYTNGDGAAYRPAYGSGFTQSYAYNQYLYHGGPPAWPPGCTCANHGYGHAEDLAYPSWMRPLVDRYGRSYGWRWGEAPSENWHITYYGGWNHPDPGVSPAHPDLKLGSGGPAQGVSVAQVQRRLQALHYFPHHVGGSFNQATRLAVYTFQVARKFAHPTGTVTRSTWIALRQPQAGAKTRVAQAHATAKLAGLKHGDRGDAVALLSKDLAFVRHHHQPTLNFYHGPVLHFFTVGLAGALRAWQADNGLSATGVYDLQSQKLMATSVRYWHKRFPAQPVKPTPHAPPPPADHPTPRPVPIVAPSGSTFWTDISGNNSSVDLRAYRASKHVIIAIKLVEGSGFRSDSAVARWKLARQLGMVRIAYDFARPSQNSCTAEANNMASYAKSIGWYRGDVATLDWEDPSYHGNGNGWVACWGRRMNQLHVRAGVLYSYGSYAGETLNSTHGLGYWHAQYTGSISSSTAPPWARPILAIQYTDGAVGGGGPLSFPGIGRGDGDKLMVSVSRLLAYAQK